MTNTYVIGVDFGTESSRALLVDTKTGKETAVAVSSYAHGVMDKTLPDGTPLKTDWALQHPQDYIDSLKDVIQQVLLKGDVQPERVIGLGIDFTSSTILPLDKNLTPLCMNPELASRPHSWVKLWKHHAAQSEADAITQLAEKSGEDFLMRYGGIISSEWMIPKVLQIINEDPELFDATDLFMEAGDWLVCQLTGNVLRSSNTSGYKAMWHKKDGYPDENFLAALHPEMTNIFSTKLRGEVRSIGEKAGVLTEKMAESLGLATGTAVAVNVIDAHAAVPAVGAVHPGQFVLAMGTSTCHMLIAEKEELIEGVCGTVEDGIIPGYVSYETGQVAVGDSFAWFVQQAVPAHVVDEAEAKQVTVHQLLEEKAMLQNPGEHGLIALDWWNGNRSVLVDSRLSGMIAGLTLATKPEDIYRALLEATAFGTRKIIDSFTEQHVPVTELFACGGLPKKNQLLMQIYADVLNCEIKIADSGEVTALGAAMYAATAAGSRAGGYDTIFEASAAMAKVKKETYTPVAENVARYNRLYKLYMDMHDMFGRKNRAWMHELKKLKIQR